MRRKVPTFARTFAACGFANQQALGSASAKPQAVALLLAITFLTIVTPSFAAEAPKHESYESRYGPLVEHNIFAKDRPIKKAATTQRSTTPPRSAEESLVLRGVTLDVDGTIRAYVEDVDNAKVLKLALGDSVGRGKIVGIDIDAVAYEHNGETTWVETGADFTGKQVIAITSDIAPSSSGGSTPTTGPAEVINPNDPNLTMEQKMKLRRLHPELFK
jgi:hypothetical protein